MFLYAVATGTDFLVREAYRPTPRTRKSMRVATALRRCSQCLQIRVAKTLS